jgi:hypothetical protein
MQASYPSPLKGHFAQNRSVSTSSALLIGILGVPVVFVMWLIAKPGGDSALTWFDDTLLFVMSFAAAVAALAAALRYRGTRTGLAWVLISIGMGFMAFGEGAWGFEELILGREVASPAVSDIGYLGFYVPVFLGLLAFPQAPVSGLRRLRLAVDAAIGTGCVAFISWHFLIADLVGQSGGFSLESAITIAYPALDLAIILGATSVILRGGRNLTNVSVALLTVGFVCIAVSDSVYTYLTQVGDYNTGSVFDTGWVFGYSLIAVAGLIAASRRLNLDSFKQEERRRAPLWQTAALNASLIPPAAVLFLHASGTELRIDYVMMIGFLTLIALALIRELILHAEHARLHNQVEEMAATLRDQVTAQRMQNLHR